MKPSVGGKIQNGRRFVVWFSLLGLGMIRSSDGCLPARSYTPLDVPPLPQVSAVADAGGKRDTRRKEDAVVARQHVKEQKKDGLALANGVHEQ